MDHVSSNGPHLDGAGFLWHDLSSVGCRRTVQRGAVCEDGDGGMVCAVWTAFIHTGNAYLNDGETRYTSLNVDRRGAPTPHCPGHRVDAGFRVLADVPGSVRNASPPQNRID